MEFPILPFKTLTKTEPKQIKPTQDIKDRHKDEYVPWQIHEIVRQWQHSNKTQTLTELVQSKFPDHSILINGQSIDEFERDMRKPPLLPSQLKPEPYPVFVDQKSKPCQHNCCVEAPDFKLSKPKPPKWMKPIPVCSICTEKCFLIDYKLMSCKHIFHRNCIDEWLKTSRTCPLCRANVVRGVEQTQV